MSESAQIISRFQNRVAFRKRLLSLQDNLAVAVLVGGLVSAAAIVYVRLKPLEVSPWLILLPAAGAMAMALVARWLFARAGKSTAPFEIDRKLGLEDRIATAASIITSGGPVRAVEEALLDDAAGRIRGVAESTVVPYRFPAWYAISLVGVVAIAAAFMVPQKTLPQEAILAEKADIESAGEQLEQAAKEVEKFVPPETVTANLAREQAELGRALKRSADTRAEALKKLAELEGKIRQRHEELAETRADEIATLAEKRLRPVVAAPPKKAQDKSASEIEARSEESTPEGEKARSDNPSKDAPSSSKEGDKQPAAAEQSPVQAKAKDAAPATSPDRKDAKDVKKAQDNPQPSVAQENKPVATSAQPAEKNAQPQESKPVEPALPQPAASPNAPSQTPPEKPGEQRQAGEQKPETGQESSNPLSTMMAEQAARAVPSLSQELLKKAEQMRAGELKPEDIRQMAKAAESLARDLAPIAQSKEFQQAVVQLASQVNPEVLERVAQELLSQENIRRELESAVRLLAQNREAREIAAGLARQFQQMFPDEPERDGKGSGENGRRRQARNSGEGNGESGRGSSAGESEKQAAENRISAQGKEQKLGGRPRKKDGGEYLFLQSRPDVGAVRVPYSSAYPRYRREAERSVERSQIPANMRRVVRSYFDAINPDAGKKQ